MIAKRSILLNYIIESEKSEHEKVLYFNHIFLF